MYNCINVCTTYDYEKHRLIYLSTYIHRSQMIHVWIKQGEGYINSNLLIHRVKLPKMG